MGNGFSKTRRFWVKLTHWEFWPFGVLYFPVYFYFAWLILRNRSFFFFTAANPSIDFGGMLGESKNEIFQLIPQEFIPKYQLFSPYELSKAQLFAESIGYPVIAKPDIGERGNLVEKIKDASALEMYVQKCPVDFLIQEFVDYPVELGVFYIRHPKSSSGAITSIVQKDFLHVVGDGESSVENLLSKNIRAQLQLDLEHPRFSHLLNAIPSRNEKVIVEGVGNHCRGTTFLNQTEQVDDSLNQAFDTLSGQIKGFHFGRFDLRCQSIEELKSLKNFKILELNGSGAEPGHIYQPGFSLWAGYKSIFWHLKILAQISRENNQLGHAYWSTKKGLKKLKMIRQYNELIKKHQ